MPLRGSGACGKPRLAMQAVAEVADEGVLVGLYHGSVSSVMKRRNANPYRVLRDNAKRRIWRIATFVSFASEGLSYLA